MAYLDNNGVTYLWGKIKTLFNKGITNLSVSGRTITRKVTERQAQFRHRTQIQPIVTLRVRRHPRTAGTV